jgi:hypothetical protein
MTVDVGSARGRIEIDTVGVQKSLSQAQRAISSFGKATSAVSTVLGVGFGAAVAAAHQDPAAAGVAGVAVLTRSNLVSLYQPAITPSWLAQVVRRALPVAIPISSTPRRFSRKVDRQVRLRPVVLAGRPHLA